MHDFIELNVNVRKVNSNIKIGGNIITIDDDFMIQGSSSLEVSPKKSRNDFRNINFDTILSGSIDKDNNLKKNVDETTKAIQNIQFVDETLQEHAEHIKKNFTNFMIEKGSNRIEIKNGDNETSENKIRAFLSEDEFKEIYFTLCENLTKRTIYKCKIDKDHFIETYVTDINEYLQNFKVTKKVEISTGKAGFTEAQIFKMDEGSGKVFDMNVDVPVEEKTDFELANYVMYHTMLPRLAIFKIINGVTNRQALNFQDIMDKVTQRILEKLRDAKASNITEYEVIDGYELDAGQVFAIDVIGEDDFNISWKVFESNANKKKAMNEYYKMDSVGEKIFAQQLENNENILMFTKLKKGGFIIDTPYGNYSPDWAIVCKENISKVGIYFIVESKFEKDWADLNDVEHNKIKCGSLHFKAISNLIRFDWIKSYDDFTTKFDVKDSI